MSTDSATREGRLQEILAVYLQDVEAGRAPNRDKLLAEHPDLADELNSFLAANARMRALVEQHEAATVGLRASAGTLPGSMVRYFGDYELLEELARGGMGVVYKARQVSLNRIVALKMILAGQFADLKDVQRFHAEAEAAANLDHPHIVPIYEVGVHEGQHFFSMRLIEGGNLTQQVAQLVAQPRVSATLLATVARAVHYAHQRGIVHRDLKPANILLAPSRTASKTTPFEPHVTDFGLAKRVDGDSGQTRTGTIVGTPSYMAPEQAGGAKLLTTAADVYSLGAILYELLTGRPPFMGSTPLDTLVKVTANEPVRPSALQPMAPRDLETICLKCLNKDPRQRYASAAALADDLERYLAHEPIQARQAGSWERVAKWIRRRPALAGLALVSGIAILTLVGLVVGLVYNQQLVEAQMQAQMALQEATVAHAEAVRQRAQAEDQKAFAENQRRRADQFRYAAEMALAYRAWQDNQVGRAHEILQKYQPARPEDPDPRGFEWHYLRRLCQAEHLTLAGAKRVVRSVAFSPDGRRVAATSGDHTIKVWDAATGTVLSSWKKHNHEIWQLAFSPDGRWLACVSMDQTMKIWEAATGQGEVILKECHSGAWSVAFSPDSKRVAVGCGDGTIRVCDAAGAQEIRRLKGHRSNVLGVAFSPDGRWLASAGADHTARIWDLNTGLETLALQGHSREVNRVAFSSDGERLATAGTDDVAKVWNAHNGQELITLKGHTDAVQDVAFSPDGAQLATTSRDQSTIIWDAKTGRELAAFKGHTASVTSVAYSPDGLWLATGSVDAKVKLWDAHQETEGSSITQGGHAEGVVFSPDGRWLAAASQNQIHIWNAHTRQRERILQQHTDRITCLAFNPDGQRLASCARNILKPFAPSEVKLWNAATGEFLLDFKGHTAGVEGVAFSPDGARLASAGLDRTVRVWDTATAADLMTLKHEQPVHAVAYSPDGRWLASTGNDALKIHDTQTGRLLHNLTGLNFAHLAISPDGTRLAGSSSTSLKVLDTVTWKVVQTLPGHYHLVTGVVFSPDGRRLASCCQGRTVKLWDLTTDQELLNLKRHTSIVSGLAFSPDGRRLASSSWDGTLRLWDAAE